MLYFWISEWYKLQNTWKYSMEFDSFAEFITLYVNIPEDIGDFWFAKLKKCDVKLGYSKFCFLTSQKIPW